MIRSVLTFCFFICLAPGIFAAEKPNIIFIMADDQGYGDASSYNPDSKIQTPGIDRIAAEGIRFTDAHSASAVCTPTRYGLITGRYPWRSRLQKGVMKTGEGNLIAPEVTTVPEMLKEEGYKTALVGKWHLGYNYEFPEGSEGLKTIKTERSFGNFKVQAAPVGSKIIDGPIAHGFDVFRGFHHAREMHSWTEDDVVVENIELDEVIARSAKSCLEFIDQQAKTESPFFLYLALGSPHSPVIPSKDWVGKSGINIYADFVMETDDVTVQILDALDKHGIAENTLIFFTTDNGCSPTAKINDLLSKGHDPSYSLRGHKADAWEGGHRVPYVARWPKVIKAGQVSDEIICHNNLMATCADILDKKLADDVGVDSFSILPIFQGQKLQQPTHPHVIHHTYSGRFAIRKGDWKYLACKNSGGWSKGGDDKPSQLYNMTEDRKESKNLIDEKAEKAAEMLALLEKSIADGRTTPGPKQANDAEVVIWKAPKAKKSPKKKKAPKKK